MHPRREHAAHAARTPGRGGAARRREQTGAAGVAAPDAPPAPARPSQSNTATAGDGSTPPAVERPLDARAHSPGASHRPRARDLVAHVASELLRIGETPAVMRCESCARALRSIDGTVVVSLAYLSRDRRNCGPLSDSLTILARSMTRAAEELACAEEGGATGAELYTAAALATLAAEVYAFAATVEGVPCGRRGVTDPGGA